MSDINVLAGLCLFVAFCIWLAWVGWLDSDDHMHTRGGLGWYREFPFLGKNFAELRHTIAIPQGMSFRLLGLNETALVIPNLLYFLGTLVVTYVALLRAFDRKMAVLAVAIMVSMPVFAIRATVVYSDITELFFIVLSLWLFLEACKRPESTGILLACGAAAGLAWATRVTTFALILVYGLMFLFSKQLPRRCYFVMGAGFLVVAGLEALFMFFMTGNPLHRYFEIFSARQGAGYQGALEGEMFDAIGNVHVSRAVDPLIALFVNHEFGILFFVYIPALIWLWRRPELATPLKTALRVLSLAGIVWFIFASVMLTNMHPRYFGVTAYTAVIVCAAWIVYGVFPRRSTFAMMIGVGIVAIGVAAIYVDNRNPLFGERALRDVAAARDQTVHTDPITARRARFLLRLDGTQDRVSSESPATGALYFYNPNRSRALTQEGKGAEKYVPDDQWEKIWESEEESKIGGRIVRLLGIEDRIPKSIFRRLDRPNLPVSLYRVPE